MLAALTFGKQSIVADAVKALREDVHMEAANELMRVERHRLPAMQIRSPLGRMYVCAEGSTECFVGLETYRL